MIKISLLVCLMSVCLGQSAPNLICYYEGWSGYAPAPGSMDIKEIDNTLCTHRIYAYNGVTKEADVLITDTWREIDKHQLYDWGHNKGSDLSLMGIGGYNFAKDLHYATEKPVDFAINLIKHLKKYNLDGAVIEWSANHWKVEYMESYVNLLQVLRVAFSLNNYVLATTVAANQGAYDVKSVARYADLIIVQSYDYRGSWNREVGHSSALVDQKHNIDQWILKGAPAKQLVVTVPAYGHTWTLTDATKTDVNSPAKGPGHMGPFTRQAGKLGVNEFMMRLKYDPSGWARHEDSAAGAVYYVNADQWVSIEDTKTAEAKGQWVKSAGLAGIAVQAINNDDFNGLASANKSPLLKAIKKGLN